MVHVGAVLAEGELVPEGGAGRDGFLIEAGDAVHAIGEEDAVPVNAGRLGEAVGDVDADTVAFDDLDGGAGGAAVVAPAFGLKPGRERVVDLLSGEVENLHAVGHFEW